MGKNYDELKLENKGQAAEKELIDALRQADIIRMCYAFKSRVKSEEKLVEKRERKIKEKPLYKLQDITDVIGIRFVTLFRIEMALVFDKIIDIITHNYGLVPNPFRNSSIEEIIYYHTDPNDHIIDMLKESLISKNLGISLVEKISEQGYSSVHIVTRLVNTVKELSLDGKEYFIPVEIQIRTVFEDAWGEIDHKYGYANRAGKAVAAPINNSENINRHLKVMKKFSDACAEYADAIHTEATKSDIERDTTGIISIAADEDLIKTFKSLSVAAEDIETFEAARNLRLEAKETMMAERAKGIAIFLQAADLFRVLSNKFNGKKILPSDRGNFLFYYYVKMNEAICLLSTNVIESVKTALAIYKHIDSIYPNFILVKMRLAQAYGKNDFIELSLEKFEEAYQELKEFERNNCPFSDNLPELDYKHVKIYLPKVYGYQLWRKSEKLDPLIPRQLFEKIELLKKAYHLTTESLGINKNIDTDMQNNLLYYGMELLILSKEHTVDIKDDSILNSLESHLIAVESNCQIENCDDIDILDTMLRAYDFYGNKENVIKILNKIFPLIEKTLATQPWDQDEILNLEKEAYEIKEKYCS